MKKKAIVFVTVLCLLGIAGCGNKDQIIEEPESKPAQTVSAEDESGEAETPDDSGSAAEPAADTDDALESLAGEYDYSSADKAGKLIIEKTSSGYDISDYESEASYRFLADSSNIEAIENNRIYIKYPEEVFSDDTVIFGYYVLEYSTDKIDVYYGKTSYDEAQFLYCATKGN